VWEIKSGRLNTYDQDMDISKTVPLGNPVMPLQLIFREGGLHLAFYKKRPAVSVIDPGIG
jgi:hypothetical protein